MIAGGAFRPVHRGVRPGDDVVGARSVVVGPHRPPQASSHLDQELVARGVAVAIVDVLELVEVDEYDRRARWAFVAASSPFVEVLGEEGEHCRPVQATRERVTGGAEL